MTKNIDKRICTYIIKLFLFYGIWFKETMVKAGIFFLTKVYTT